MADIYKEVRVLTFPNMTATVHIPDLTPEEREQRMKIVHRAVANLLRNSVLNKGE